MQLGNVTPVELADGSVMAQFDSDGYPQHTVPVVFREMIVQVCMDYPGLPDVRSMDVDEIAFFYDGLRPALRKHTAK